MILLYIVPPLPTSSEDADAVEDFSACVLKHPLAIFE